MELTSETELEAQWQRLRAKLLAQAHILSRHGTLCSDGHLPPSWRVRYCELDGNGRSVNRIITVGRNPELIDRVRRFLHQLRTEAQWRGETILLVQAASSLLRKLRARLPQTKVLVRERTAPEGHG
jgi:hypothetical protein